MKKLAATVAVAAILTLGLTGCATSKDYASCPSTVSQHL